MPRRIHNWSAGEVVKFLKKYGFRHMHTRGSHFHYFGRYNGKDRIVQVPFHGKETINPRTMKSIINQSGIPKEEWFNN